MNKGEKKSVLPERPKVEPYGDRQVDRSRGRLLKLIS